MKKLLVASFLVIAAFAPRCAPGQVSDSLVRALMDQYDVPGLALAIVQGDSTFTYGWGHADADGKIAVTANTPFRIASVAKVFVTATVVTEVSEGTIRLEDDVSDLIPRVGRFWGPITLHDLLTHTAGFDERLIGYAARSADDMKPLGAYLAERMPSRGWPVGEQISYSNHGMALAAWAVERARGNSFAEVAREQVFEPLGMTSTVFLTRGKSVPAESAAPLSCEDGTCQRISHLFSHAYPAGLAFSTARDMSRFVAAVLHADEDKSPLAALIPARFTHDERLAGMSYGFFNQIHKGFRFLSHAGSVPGYSSLLLISPEADLGFFFVTNGGSSRFGERFRDEILSAFLGDEPGHPPVPSVSEEARRRAGIYELTRYSHETIERFPQVFVNSIEAIAKGDTLMIVAGGRVRKYIQTGKALYESLEGDDRIAFGTRRGEPRLFRSSFVYGGGVPVAYEKRPWYRAPGFLNEYVSWLLGAPVLILFLLWPVGAGVGLFLRKRRGAEQHAAYRIAGGVAVLTALTVALFAVFGFGFIARSNRMLESGELFFGMPDTLMIFTWIPAVHAVLTALMCAAFVLAWKNRWWDVTRRLLFSIVLGMLVLQVGFLVQWNYLPMSW